MRRLAGLAMTFLASVAHAEPPSATPAAVNQALMAGKPAVIDLGARSCAQCKKMAPVLETLAAEYRGKAGVLFIDVSADSAAAERFKVRLIPTQIFFDARGKEVKRHIGYMDKAAIVKELNAAGLK
jgi:thioredoxin 1